MMASRMTNSRGLNKRVDRYGKKNKEEYIPISTEETYRDVLRYRTYTPGVTAVETDDDGSVHLSVELIDTTHGQD